MKWIGAVIAALVLAACSSGSDAQKPDLDIILADSPAPTLAEYGFFTDSSAHEPASGVVPYDLINPLFSDYAAKHRLVFVPDGGRATYKAEGVFDFPVGSVLIKSFAFAPDMRAPSQNERYIETRLLIHKAEGWIAYPYVWNDAQTEAVYTPIGSKHEIETISPSGEALAFTYLTPNKNQCKTCHQSGDNIMPIGPAAKNLNHNGPLGDNQIAYWSAHNILTGAPDNPPAVTPVSDTAASLNARARAYLDINCAHCHKADGSASNSGLWLTTDETNSARLGLSKYPTAAGRGGGDSIHVITPGAPDKSILTYRLASTEAGVAMPELGRSTVHAEGLALLEAWIAEMEAE